MVAVPDHGDRQACAAQGINQLGCDALRDDDGEPGMHTQSPDMGDCRNGAGQPRQATVIGRERIATTVDDLASILAWLGSPGTMPYLWR